MTLKQKLIELRAKTGLNQTDFAAKVGCKSSHISQMELGKSPVSLKTLCKYADVFGRSYSISLDREKKVLLTYVLKSEREIELCTEFFANEEDAYEYLDNHKLNRSITLWKVVEIS